MKIANILNLPISPYNFNDTSYILTMQKLTHQQVNVYLILYMKQVAPEAKLSSKQKSLLKAYQSIEKPFMKFPDIFRAVRCSFASCTISITPHRLRRIHGDS